MRPYTVALALGLALVPASGFTQVPVGAEFRVNTYTTNDQDDPRIAANDSGQFVLTWSSRGQDGGGRGVFARRYDGTGAPMGADEFQVNTYTTANQGRPVVGLSPTGTMLFAWESDGQDGSEWGVYGRQFEGSGLPLSDDFQMSAYTSGGQLTPSVSAGASNFVVVWSSEAQDGSNYGMFGRTAFSPEFQVNTFTTGEQGSYKSAVAMAADGRFVVVWQGAGVGDSFGIFAQRFDANAAPTGPEFRVNVYTTNDQRRPSVASDAEGNFVVVWTSYGQPGGEDRDLVGRRFDAGGVAQGGEFLVNEVTALAQDEATVALDARGSFVVAWQGPGQQYADVFARVFDRDGPTGPQFTAAAYAGHQGFPTVAWQADGHFVLAWAGSDGAGFDDVFARRFLPDLIFRDGFESGDLSAWSGNANDSGDLTVHVDAAQAGTLTGLRGVVDDVAPLYVQDDTPDGEPRYRARFWIDPNGFDPGEAEAHRRTRVFIAFTEAPSRRVAAIVLRRQFGIYGLMARARLDDNSQADAGFFLISDAPHAVELDLRPASGPDAQDGSLELFIDGISMGQQSGLDNSLAAVDFVRMGALSAKSGAFGIVHWDQFEARRLNYIGP